MNITLKQFLLADDLDNLLSIKDNLSQLDEEERATIALVLQDWTDEQAVANLLFHPDLIPKDKQFTYIIKALQETQNSYYTLAAVVGLQRLPRGAFTESQRQRISEALLRRIESQNEVIAPRASISLADYLVVNDVTKVEKFLKSDNEIIRHNILVLMIGLIGLESSRAMLRSLIDKDVLDNRIVQILSQQITEIDSILTERGVDQIKFFASNLSAPILTYIPNLKDWDR